MSVHYRPQVILLFFWILQIAEGALHRNLRALQTEEETRTSKEKAREYGLLLLWGFFLLSVFIVATYVLNHFMDRCCCCCVYEPEEMDQGLVSRKAQLFGLTLSERAKLLVRIFPSSLCWQPDETPLPVASLAETAEDPLTDLQHDRACCICLLPYEPGVHILKGTTCQHTFHYSCCMEWLTKHDECPYCRRELFTASELRAAAMEVLGEARVRAMGFNHLNLSSSVNETSLPSADATSSENVVLEDIVAPLSPTEEDHVPVFDDTTPSYGTKSIRIKKEEYRGQETPLESQLEV
jgi:hypothetical protein